MTENSVGWMPWATAMPKDYLVKFVASGGPKQLVLIDNTFPKIQYDLTEPTQERLTDTLSLFIHQVADIANFSPSIVTTSKEMTASDYLSVNHLTIKALKDAMPIRLSENFEGLSVQEFTRTIAHIANTEYLVRNGATEVLSVSAQKRFAELTRDVNFTFITPNRSISEHLKSKLPEKLAREVLGLISLWDSANILRGSKLEKKITNELANPNNESAPMARLLSQDFEGQKTLAVLLPPEDFKNPENIFLIIGREINIPPTLSGVRLSQEDVERFKQKEITLAHVEATQGYKPVNLLFLNAEEAENLYLRSDPLKTNSSNDFIESHGIGRDKVGSLILQSSIVNPNSEFIGIKLALLGQLQSINKLIPADLSKSVEGEISALKQILEIK